MKRFIIMKGLLIVVFFITVSPAIAEASGGKPGMGINLKPALKLQMQRDTVPPVPVKKVDTENEKPAPVVIKALPAPRKQAIPVPVKVKTVPVKVIKPKVLKPIINLLP